MDTLIKELQTGLFKVVSHGFPTARGSENVMRLGVHCPKCGKFYAQGQFTLEHDGYVLGKTKSEICCGEERSTPMTFETVEEVERFLRSINRSVGIEARLIKKSSLDMAHFWPGAILEAIKIQEKGLH